MSASQEDKNGQEINALWREIDVLGRHISELIDVKKGLLSEQLVVQERLSQTNATIDIAKGTLATIRRKYFAAKYGVEPEL